jgi:hypothetical protein
MTGESPSRAQASSLSVSNVASRAKSLAVRVLVPKENLADAIYGLILGGALMAAESALPESHLDVVGSVAITLSVYWLADAYAFALSRRVESGKRLSLRSLREGLAHTVSVVQGAIVPELALLIGWVVGASSRASLSAAVWSTVIALIALELLAGVRAKAGAVELVLDCCVGAGIGASVLLLRALLH